MKALFDFLIENWPSWPMLLLGGPVALLWAGLGLCGAGLLKRRAGWRTGYTRKLFHFFTFGSVAAIQLVWGTMGVCLFGAMSTVVIGYAVWQGDGHLLYEAMAREKDAPRRSYYIIAPYLATLSGGLIGNIVWGEAAVFGYLVTGIADAVAEPVGTAFGRHPYKVPSLRGVRATRTLEGSAAVAVGSVLAIVIAGAMLGVPMMSPRSVGVVLALSLVCTGAEAVSPHGWDNLVLQVLPSWLASIYLVGAA